jgi:hypothetical protein
VRVLLLDQEAGMLALRVQGVGGDHGAGQVERGQQAGEAGNLVGLVRDPQMVTVRPVPVTADSKWAAGASSVRTASTAQAAISSTEAKAWWRPPITRVGKGLQTVHHLRDLAVLT